MLADALLCAVVRIEGQRVNKRSQETGRGREKEREATGEKQVTETAAASWTGPPHLAWHFIYVIGSQAFAGQQNRNIFIRLETGS